MKRIVQDIKNQQFSTLYLLYGDETYLKRQYRDRLRDALVPKDDSMNSIMYLGKNTDVEEVYDLVNTMPFFAEKRVVVVENSGWFKNTNERAIELVKNIPETTVVIFVEQEVDKRGKMYKTVSANGYVALCEMQDEETLKKWIIGLLNKENKHITQEAVNLLLDRTGTSMENIRHEVEKLVCYKYYDEGITAEDVEQLCIVQVQNKIFDMVEAVAAKNQKTALDLYYDLIALKEAPMKILSLVARQFNMLLLVREMKKKGYSETDIATRTGLNPYFLKKKYIPQASHFKQHQLEAAVKACVEAEENVKTGKMPDILSVELIIVGLSTK